jgi:hypothetical protein
VPVSIVVIWLKCASVALMIFAGVFLALGAHPAASGVAYLFTDVVIWPFDGAQSLAAPETRIFMAVCGGGLAGWGVLVWLVAGKVLPDNPALGREILVKSLMTWFAIDSTCSILAGVPVNAAANVLFLLAFLYPLWRMERQNSAAPHLQ